MGTAVKYEYLDKNLLNEFCFISDDQKKYAIRLLNKKHPLKVSKNLSKRGQKKMDDGPLLIQVLRNIWIITNLPYSKRLKAILPLWLPYHNKRPLTNDIQQRRTIKKPLKTAPRFMACLLPDCREKSPDQISC